MITEFVKLKKLETTTDKQLLSTADTLINDFWKQQDCFVDAELVKNIENNEWCFIYHFESMEKVKAIGEQMRASKEFGQFISLVNPENIKVTFNQQIKKWF